MSNVKAAVMVYHSNSNRENQRSEVIEKNIYSSKIRQISRYSTYISSYYKYLLIIHNSPLYRRVLQFSRSAEESSFLSFFQRDYGNVRYRADREKKTEKVLPGRL